MTQEQRKAKIAKLIGTLDDEAFTWLALAVSPRSMTLGAGVQIWPDGLGGFHDREKIEAIRKEAAGFIEHARRS